MSRPIFQNPGATRLSLCEEARVQFNKIILAILANKGDSLQIGNVTFENIGDGSYGYDLPSDKWDTKAISKDLAMLVEARGLSQSDILV